MNKKLYIGNLKWSINDDGLRNLFSGTGNLVSASVILDRETGRSRGFGFIEFENEEDARVAIETQNGRSVEGRPIIVKEAQPEGTRENNPTVGLTRAITSFADNAILGDHYGFTLGTKHFTVTMDSKE